MKPDTQLEAWQAIQDSLCKKQNEVLQVIKSAPKSGKTLFELVDALEWPVNRISGRVRELSQKGLIVDSGARRINPASGKNGIVWIYVKQ